MTVREGMERAMQVREEVSLNDKAVDEFFKYVRRRQELMSDLAVARAAV